MEQDSHIQLVRLIQRGGVALVWEGFDARLERKVLVKQIHEHIAQDEELRLRFEREARAVARLKPHPNVVQVYELTEIGKQPAIVMEYVTGMTLAKLVADRGPLPMEIAATILIEILNGLEQIHLANIVHRDMKPANVLVSEDGEIKITDFGFATLHDQPSYLTMEGAPLGTPAYMAPEQAWGELTGTTTDIFATGLVFFTLLTGRSYVQGDQWQQAFMFMREYKSPRLTPYREFIPKPLMPVMWRMLRANPAKRFATAAETRAAVIAAIPSVPLPRALLKDYLGGQSIRKPQAKPLPRRRAARELQMIAAVIIVAALAFVVSRFMTASGERDIANPVAPDSARQDSQAIPVAMRDTEATSIPPKLDKMPIGEKPLVDKGEQMKKVTSPEPKSEKNAGPGWIRVSCTPYAAVSTGDTLYGVTPLATPIQLPSGIQTLTLRNEEVGFPISVDVSVTAGETTRVQFNLYEHVAQVRAAGIKPWADVYINGKLRIEAGSARTIFLPFGTYEIELRHPKYGSHSYTTTLRKGDPIHEISVDLTHL